MTVKVPTVRVQRIAAIAMSPVEERDRFRLRAIGQTIGQKRVQKAR